MRGHRPGGQLELCQALPSLLFWSRPAVTLDQSACLARVQGRVLPTGRQAPISPLGERRPQGVWRGLVRRPLGGSGGKPGSRSEPQLLRQHPPEGPATALVSTELS